MTYKDKASYEYSPPCIRKQVNANTTFFWCEDARNAFSCRSLFANEPLIIGLFCGKWPVMIRHPMHLRHPVLTISFWCRCVCVSGWKPVCMCVYSVCIYICVYVYVYIDMYIYMYIYVHTYIYIYICVCIYMYIYMHMYTHAYSFIYIYFISPKTISLHAILESCAPWLIQVCCDSFMRDMTHSYVPCLIHVSHDIYMYKYIDYICMYMIYIYVHIYICVYICVHILSSATTLLYLWRRYS